MDTGFSTNQLYTACRLSLTHHYEPGDTYPEGSGTGFLVGFPSPDGRLGLVTNRHVVDVPWEKPEREGTRVHTIVAEWWQSKELRLKHTITKPKPLYHDDPSIDVAIIPLTSSDDAPLEIFGTFYGNVDQFVAEADQDTLIFEHALSWDYLLECEQLWPQLQPGEFVTFPGYPIWYDRLQIRPVLRSGVIASDPQTDYRVSGDEPRPGDGNQQVLFDAFSTSGNSGSPVYVAQRGLAPIDMNFPLGGGRPALQGRMTFADYRRSFLIGINMGHYNNPDSVRPNDHAGLSRMHKLSAIMDILRANQAPNNPDVRRIRLYLPAQPSA